MDVPQGNKSRSSRRCVRTSASAAGTQWPARRRRHRELRLSGRRQYRRAHRAGFPATSIIALPVHYIAASNAGGEFTFFDPNCGAAYTNNARNFATMYKSFFSSSQVSDTYEQVGKNPRHTPVPEDPSCA